MIQVSKQWSMLEKAERQFYMQMAIDDKRRFEAQMQDLRTPASYKVVEPPGYLELSPPADLQRFYSLERQSSERQELSPLMMHKHACNSLFEFDYRH